MYTYPDMSASRPRAPARVLCQLACVRPSVATRKQ